VVRETPQSPSYGKKCSVAGCNADWTERFNGYSILMCRRHADDFYLKVKHDQFAQVEIMLSRNFEKEAKEKGMSNLEYYKFCNPAGKSFFGDTVLKNFRTEKSPAEVSAAVDKKIEQDRLIASHHENMVPAAEKGVNFDEIDFIGYDELFK
jgi:hypothetical protein